VRIDAAVHVWSADPSAFPWSPDAPTPDRSATPEELAAELASVDFDGAICIQPRAYGADHRYLLQAVAAQGDRLAGVCLVHPTAPNGPDVLRRLVDGGCAGVRLLPYDVPDADWLAGPAGDPLWEEAGRLGVSVSVLARGDQLGDLLDRARRHPQTTVVVDHLAMVVPAEDPAAAAALLACADAGNVLAKVSSLGLMARTPWPYEDLQPLLRDVVAAFGPERTMFGTDWPNTRRYGPYRLSLDAFDRAVDLDDTARDLVLGGTARRLWLDRAI